jgi:hypothetical protein
LITWILFGEEHTSWSSLLSSCFQSLATSFLCSNAP